MEDSGAVAIIFKFGKKRKDAKPNRGSTFQIPTAGSANSKKRIQSACDGANVTNGYPLIMFVTHDYALLEVGASHPGRSGGTREY